MNNSGIDEKDIIIIKMLVGNARLTYSDIAAEVGLSRVAVKNRICALEEKGIIKGYHADIDSPLIPEMSTFVAVIKTTAAAYEEISEILKKEPCVKTLCKMSGDNQLHAVCIAKDMNEMRNFAYKIRTCDSGILSFSAQMVWEIIKGNMLPD